MILNEARATIALAWPIIGTQLAQVAINTTDVMLLAHYSESALAASAIGMSAFFVVWVVGLGIALATPALAAQALGRDATDRAGVRAAVQSGLLMVAVYGGVTAIPLWFSAPLLEMAGQPPALAQDAEIFLRALCFGLVPSLWFVVLRSFTSALERPRAAMLLMAAAVVLNAVLNYGLIFGALGLPEWGLLGAGLGSSIVHVFTFVGLVVVIRRDREFAAYDLLRGWWRVGMARSREFVAIGGPVALTFGAEVGLFSTATLLMGHLGETEVAAHQVAQQLATVTFMVPMGIAQAATVRVGLAAGGRDWMAARRAALVALILAVGFMSLTAVLFRFGGGWLIGLFLPDVTGTTFALGVVYLAWAGVFQIADGIQAAANGALRGLKDTAVPMLLAGAGYWLVGLPVAFWLGLYTPLRGEGIWMGLLAGLFVVSILLTGRLYLVLRKAA